MSDKSTEITNSQDIIDSRDIIARIELLESEREEFTLAITDRQEDAASIDAETEERSSRDDAISEAEAALVEWDESDDGKELAVLKALAEEAEGYADWRDGATLIRESYFEEYARCFADDIGAVNRNASWPNSCIDWKRAAEELQQDYTSVDFDGVTYWVR